MKKVTSMTILTTAEGKRLSITHSELDDLGNIVSENNRTNRVIVDLGVLKCVEELEAFSYSVVNTN